MASNSFGQHFRITTWGESHGKAIGVVIDGCPAGLTLSENMINQALAARAPGKSPFTSPRKEPDDATIYSGLFEQKTTGAPISIIIPNKDADSSHYEDGKYLLRPGHANFTYLEKYGCFDYRGGGRASARETACRVAAGAVAQALLNTKDIRVTAFLHSVGEISIQDHYDYEAIVNNLNQSRLFCPEPSTETKMIEAINDAKSRGDSLGGIVSFYAEGLPTGLGDPVYSKLEANLAAAMMSLPATKGFELGEGFSCVKLSGTQHNDAFEMDGTIQTKTNHAGGTLGGISTGMPLLGRVAFKPTSSIKQAQQTVNQRGERATFIFPRGSRHDPCVAIRAVPVVKSMCSLVLADALLHDRMSRL